jgi:hypothetical protein
MLALIQFAILLEFISIMSLLLPKGVTTLACAFAGRSVAILWGV